MIEAPGTNNVLYYGRCGGSAATYRPRPRFGAPNAITPATIKTPSPAVTIPPHQRPARVTPRRHQLPITLPPLILTHYLATDNE